jgi:hypothetical protein
VVDEKRRGFFPGRSLSEPRPLSPGVEPAEPRAQSLSLRSIEEPTASRESEVSYGGPILRRYFPAKLTRR